METSLFSWLAFGDFSVCSPPMLSWSEIVLRRASHVSWEICLQITQASASFQGIFNPRAFESKSDWINRENFELNFRCLKLLARYDWVVWGLCACHICSFEACIGAVQSEVPFIISYLSSAVPVLYVWWWWNSQYKNQLGEINSDIFPFSSIWSSEFQIAAPELASISVQQIF